jgi:hypothetical protein
MTTILRKEYSATVVALANRNHSYVSMVVSIVHRLALLCAQSVDS